MMLKLDTSRNKLLIVNTSFAVYLAAIGFSAYLTGWRSSIPRQFTFSFYRVSHIFIVCFLFFYLLSVVFSFLFSDMTISERANVDTEWRCLGTVLPCPVGAADVWGPEGPRPVPVPSPRLHSAPDTLTFPL